jgi:alanyl aminopeptidase
LHPRARHFVGLLLIVLIGGAWPFAQAGDVSKRRLPETVAPLAYEARVTIDPAKERFDAALSIDVQLEQATDIVWLNAVDLSLRAARIAPLEPAGEALDASIVSGHPNVVGLRFARPVGPGTARLAIEYSGAIDGAGNAGVFRQRDGDAWYAFTQFEPQYARRVFPSFDDPGRKTVWKLTVLAPEGNAVYSNMPVEAQRAVERGWREWRFQPTPPLPTYLVAFAVGPFERRDAGKAGVNATPVGIVVPKGRLAEAAYAARETPAILAALERYFGRAYPFAKLDLIAYPQGGTFGAMENPGLVTYRARLLLARRDEADIEFQQTFVEATAHELAHMWFGNFVTPAAWDDVWLNESFASWLATRTTAELKPAWRWELTRTERRGWAVRTDRLASARRVRESVRDDDVLAAFDSITYAKGESLLTMIEAWMGAEEFRDAVRRYLARHAFANATSEDFLAAVAHTRPDIAAALRGFLDRPGVPLVDVAVRCAGGRPELELAQRRFVPVGGTAPEGPPWVMPVCVDFGDARTERSKCVVLGEAQLRVALDFPRCPTSLGANRDGFGYYVARVANPAPAGTRDERRLTTAELIATLSDADLLAASGLVPYPDALALAARGAAHADARVALAAFRLLGNLPEEVAPRDARWHDWVRRRFGGRAHDLGWLPRTGEAPDLAALRAIALPLVAQRGRDTAVGREARVLAQRWQRNAKALPAPVRRIVLTAAARSAARDAAPLFDAMVARAGQSTERNEREDILWALGAFADPALTTRTAALALDARFAPREAVLPLRSALENVETRPVAMAWLERNADALMDRTPREARGFWPGWAGAGCTPDYRAAYVRAFASRAPNYDAGAAQYAKGLERIDLCIALRDAQAPALAQFAAAQR